MMIIRPQRGHFKQETSTQSQSARPSLTESMNPEGVSALVDALLAVPARRDHVQSEEEPRA